MYWCVWVHSTVNRSIMVVKVKCFKAKRIIKLCVTATDYGGCTRPPLFLSLQFFLKDRGCHVVPRLRSLLGHMCDIWLWKLNKRLKKKKKKGKAVELNPRNSCFCLFVFPLPGLAHPFSVLAAPGHLTHPSIPLPQLPISRWPPAPFCSVTTDAVKKPVGTYCQ